MNSYMILNNESIGISYIELNEDDLLIYSKDSKYCFKAYISGSWRNIRNLKVNETKEIEFKEYCLSENNIPALILPTISTVQKPNENQLLFYFKCENFNNIVYMSMKTHFDIELNSLQIQVLFNLKDFVNSKIIYRF